MPKLAVVALESSLVGRLATPAQAGEPGDGLWPFLKDKRGLPNDPANWTETAAEVVAAYIGELNEGGELTLGLRGFETGNVRTIRARYVNLGPA